MSGAAFEGLEPQVADSLAYTPGLRQEPHPLVREIVEDYLGKGEYWLTCRRSILWEELAPLIGPALAELPSHQALLDDAIHAAAQNTLTTEDERGGAILLTEMVGALYAFGGNDFAVDLTSLSRGGVGLEVGYGLIGSADRPLEAAFSTPAWVTSFGAYTEDARLTLKGRSTGSGSAAKKSVLTLLGKASVMSVGYTSSSAQCAYYLGEPDYGIPMQTVPPTDDPLVATSVALKLFGFFERGNRLFVPDPDDSRGWKEVLP